ncbi:MAG: hypothetical protein JK586_07745 [Nocardiopsis sp. BM-2018]|nr:MAG: hypothetical protein JK586_07745 [Nocardiopsis sp. BM-2018]
MPHNRLAALALLAAVAATSSVTAAETPMSAEEFDTYVTGRTLTFGLDGVPYGIEQFKEGRRVLWAFIGEECRNGVWFPHEDQICFAYEDDPRTHCWHFWLTDQGLRARFIDDAPGDEIYEVEQSPRPMFCPGPQIGV